MQMGCEGQKMARVPNGKLSGSAAVLDTAIKL